MRSPEIRTLSVKKIDDYARVEHLASSQSFGPFGYTNSTPEQKRRFIGELQQKIALERQRVHEFSRTNSNRRLDPLISGSWFRQRNAMGMWTCQFTNAINALRFIKQYDPNIHTEEEFIGIAGGIKFARENPHGCALDYVVKGLEQLAPKVKLRGSDSVSEMLQAAADGAAVMFPYSHNHEALIPPGFRLKNGRESLEVQIANPLSRDLDPEYLQIDRLLMSEIIALKPGAPFFQNNVLIIEAPSAGIRTISRSVGIRTVSKS